MKVIFSGTLRARAMELGSCKHLNECSLKLPSILNLDLHFTVHRLCKFLSSFCVKVNFSETIGARAMKLGSIKHLKEQMSTQSSFFSIDLLFMVH